MVHRRSLKKEPFSKSSNNIHHYSVITLFPQVLKPYLKASLLGRAQKNRLLKVDLIPLRKFSPDKHHRVDDSPYGGGEGMVIRADVLKLAWEHAKLKFKQKPFKTLFLSPQGATLTARMAKHLAQEPRLLFIAGHYEGIDERFKEAYVDEEISIGDYVLSGGELPALTLIDAVSRFIPGVVGNPVSVQKDSFEGGRLKYPQYTRPSVFEGRAVPQVLLSGNHLEIAEWREKMSLEQTLKKRPDLLPLED